MRVGVLWIAGTVNWKTAIARNLFECEMITGRPDQCSKSGDKQNYIGKEKGRAGGDAQPLIPNAAMGGGGAAFNLLDLGGGVIQREVNYFNATRTTIDNIA